MCHDKLVKYSQEIHRPITRRLLDRKKRERGVGGGEDKRAKREQTGPKRHRADYTVKATRVAQNLLLFSRTLH